MRKTAGKISVLLFALLAAVMITTAAGAATLQGGRSMGKAAVMKKYKTSYVGRITDTKKELWYRFKTQSYDAFYTITVKNLSVPNSVHIYMTDMNEEEVASRTWVSRNESFECNIKLKRNNWYYLHIVNEDIGKGNVKLTVTARKDAVGDTRGKAKTIPIRSAYSGSMDGVEDIDYLKFKPTKARYYTITLKNVSVTSSIHVYVTDRYEEELASKTWISKNEALEIKLKLKKGQYYYIMVDTEEGTGKYKALIK